MHTNLLIGLLNSNYVFSLEKNVFETDLYYFSIYVVMYKFIYTIYPYIYIYIYIRILYNRVYTEKILYMDIHVYIKIKLSVHETFSNPTKISLY